MAARDASPAHDRPLGSPAPAILRGGGAARRPPAAPPHPGWSGRRLPARHAGYPRRPRRPLFSPRPRQGRASGRARPLPAGPDRTVTDDAAGVTWTAPLGPGLGVEPPLITTGHTVRVRSSGRATGERRRDDHVSLPGAAPARPRGRVLKRWASGATTPRRTPPHRWPHAP